MSPVSPAMAGRFFTTEPCSGGAIGKELPRQSWRHKRHKFSPWVSKIPCRIPRAATSAVAYSAFRLHGELFSLLEYSNLSDTSKCGCHASSASQVISSVLQLFYLFAFFCLLEFLSYLVSQEQVSFSRHVSHLLLLIEVWIFGTVPLNSFLLPFRH